MPTLLFDGHDAKLDDNAGAGLWLDASQLESATGFRLEPQGFCRGELCVPIPPGDKARFVDGSRVSVAALAAQLRRPTLRDDAHGVISIGPEPGSRLDGAEAPDFSLPDFDGVQHSLSQYRGKKVLIMTWASW
jgi:hypothetical protein